MKVELKQTVSLMAVELNGCRPLGCFIIQFPLHIQYFLLSTRNDPMIKRLYISLLVKVQLPTFGVQMELKLSLLEESVQLLGADTLI